MSEVRVRFAPSPTGYLHVGGLRTALFNYLFAAGHQGKLILRIEDTDQNRKVEGSVENLLQSLKWSNIRFDEGSHLPGNYGPYIQSQRIKTYQKYAKQLMNQGHAYPCFCSTVELDEMREIQVKKKQTLGYDGKCLKLDPKDLEQKMNHKESFVVRLKIDRKRSHFLVQDLIRGKVEIPREQVDEQILLKSDGFPTYHLANVIDDHLMKISHVIRGEEWLSSTPKHLQLYEYLGWEPPQFAHLPLLLNPDRSKLSKRQGDVATDDYRKKGILSEALINFIALLGWNTSDDQEIFSLKELIALFRIEKVGKAGAIFDMEKLHWMNQKYISAAIPETLLYKLEPFLPKQAKILPKDILLKITSLLKNRLITLNDINSGMDIFLNSNLTVKDEKLKRMIRSETSQNIFQTFLEEMKKISQMNAKTFLNLMKQIQKITGIKGKNLWIPMRLALTYEEHGPELPLVAEIYGLEKCKKLIENILI